MKNNKLTERLTVYEAMWYAKLLKVSNSLEKIFESKLFERLVGNQTKIPALIKNGILKQKEYFEHERVLYIQKLIWIFSLGLMCFFGKQCFIGWLLFKLTRLFYVPKRFGHKLTFRYKVNALQGIPLLILSIILPGIYGAVMGAVSIAYYTEMCNERDFTNKYLYCKNEKQEPLIDVLIKSICGKLKK